uniref:Uncharacterized protein n=1 Tax=Anguilla anguilla TaxID=7936 RepID=A0A0E9XDJ3_ANGAN
MSFLCLQTQPQNKIMATVVTLVTIPRHLFPARKATCHKILSHEFIKHIRFLRA